MKVWIGPTPGDEKCAQVGRDNYSQIARLECRIYIKQLRRIYGQEPEGATLIIHAESHSFGSCYEVVCSYDSEKQVAVEYAYKVETGAGEWDEEARKELTEAMAEKGLTYA